MWLLYIVLLVVGFLIGVVGTSFFYRNNPKYLNLEKALGDKYKGLRVDIKEKVEHALKNIP